MITTLDTQINDVLLRLTALFKQRWPSFAPFQWHKKEPFNWRVKLQHVAKERQVHQRSWRLQSRTTFHRMRGNNVIAIIKQEIHHNIHLIYLAYWFISLLEVISFLYLDVNEQWRVQKYNDNNNNGLFHHNNCSEEPFTFKHSPSKQ